MGRELIYIFFSLVQALTITIEGSLFRPKKERKKIYLPQVLPRVNPTLKSHVETKLTYVPALVKMDESALSLSLSLGVELHTHRSLGTEFLMNTHGPHHSGTNFIMRFSCSSNPKLKFGVNF